MRNDVFLRQHLDGVSDGLEQAEWTNAVGSVTILKTSEAFAFHERRNSETSAEHRHDRRDGKASGDNRLERFRPERERENPSLDGDENLVECLHQGFASEPG